MLNYFTVGENKNKEIDLKWLLRLYPKFRLYGKPTRQHFLESS